MSIKYPYLKLSLRYVHGVKSTTVFSYPSNEKAQRASFDATAILSRFVNLNEFYVTGCHDSRRYFSFVSVDDTDRSGARLELTLSVDSNVLLPGRSILNIFNCVKDMLDNDEAFNDETLSAAIAASGFSDEPLRSAAAYPGNDVENNPCYRTYVSANELGTILSFPRQSAYTQHSEVALVHVTAVPVAENPLPQISGPVTQAFTVVCPADVTPSAESVEITDHLALTYTRAGFEPSTVSFEVGTTNRYVKITGPALLVNDAVKAGIVFMQRVAYNVVSSKGTAVNTYTILINGRTATRADGMFEVTSNDFNQEGTVNISVSSTNYFTTSIDYTSQELAAQQPLELVLVPEEIPAVLRLDFGDGRLLQQEIMFEKSSAEYRQLRAGSFHGFRAHRLMSHEPETYNVDMSAAPAVAPRQQETVASAAPAVRTVADTYTRPAAETVEKSAENTVETKSTPLDRPKSAAELRAERLRRDIPQKPETTADDTTAETRPAEPEVTKKNKRKKMAYADDIPRKIDILEDDPDDDEEETRSRSFISPVILAAIAVVLITAGIVWYLFTLLPSEETGTDHDAIDITEAEAAATNKADRISVIDDLASEPTAPEQSAPQNQQAAAAAGPSAEEQADIDYLNSHDTWRIADIKSQKYRDFFNSLGEGNIDAIANADYFAVKEQATNKKALKVIDYLWEAKGTFAEKRNVNAMKELKGKESIDMHRLYETLARMRDSKPNTEPRPQR